MKLSVIILTLTVLNISLSNSIPDKITNSSYSNNYSNNTAKYLSEKLANDNFIDFWQTFRKAVIENDTTKIIKLTHFPFETRAPMDSDPIVKYEKKEFLKVFRAYLEQTTYLKNDLNPITSLEQIKRIQIPDKNDIEDKWARIGNLVFQKIKGQWYLTFAYLEYPTIEKINNKI